MVSDSGRLKEVGGLLGTSVSGVFLVVIGLLNLLILLDIFWVYRRMRRGEYDRGFLREELVAGGLMTRVFGRLFRVVSTSWHMYLIGFLFGFGFDIAFEVALLAIFVGAVANGV